MDPPFARWLVSYMGDLRRVGEKLKAEGPGWARLRAEAERDRYTEALYAQNWERLAELARAELSARNNSLGEIRKVAKEVADLSARLPDVVTAVGWIPPIHERAAYEGHRRRVAASLEAAGRSRAETSAALASLDRSDLREVGELPGMLLARASSSVMALVERHLGAAVGATLAMAVARLNSAVAPTTTRGLQRYLTESRAELDDWERAIWQALRSGATFEVRGLATTLSEAAARRLFASTVPFAALLARRRASAAGDSELGRSALEVAQMARRQLRAIALGRLLMVAAQWPIDREPLRGWARAAESARAGGEAYRWPQEVEIDELRERTRRSGLVTVEGCVREIEITHRGRKAISRVEVERRGASINAVLPYIRVDSGGLVPGAWCRLAGVWNPASAEAGVPALELDRLALSELAKRGWQEAATRELASVFVPVPHALAAAWSWQPGIDGPGNQLRYGTWIED